MGITELLLILSITMNWWQWGELAESNTKQEAYMVAASACQEAKFNNRQTELRSSSERVTTEKNIRGIITRSELDLREIDRTTDKVDSDKCDVQLHPVGSKRVEERIKRSNAINSEWVRSPSTPNE